MTAPFIDAGAPHTAASCISVCAECGTAVKQVITASTAPGRTLLGPCGHEATIVVVPNPKVSEA